MWEPFTERARKALVFAQEVEELFPEDKWITPNHLFLGILKDDTNSCSQILATYGVTFKEACRVRYEQGFGAQSGRLNSSDSLQFTAQSKKVIEDAFKHARKLCHNYIGTEHLFLALLDHVNADLIDALHLGRDILKKHLLEKLGHSWPVKSKIHLVDNYKLVRVSMVHKENKRHAFASLLNDKKEHKLWYNGSRDKVVFNYEVRNRRTVEELTKDAQFLYDQFQDQVKDFQEYTFFVTPEHREYFTSD